ncbi:hypothetical protein [Alteromonas sp. RKMC-009]|uniref:hypothetical protein n=1 Tax=Alteromonas sp. RKMC-009 TaxID=2267264 RepID=UPI000E67B4C8|nr:hypothetical protein [Alteromonas sp. RKMC-009]AYA64183.1 hypothetical protein DS731_09370 [Alteromonas sp. RKMC-009]
MLNTQTKNAPFKYSLLATLLAVSLAGCSGSDGDDGMDGMDGADGQDGTPVLTTGTFLRANNGDENRGTVDWIDQDGDMLSSFETGANEGIVLSYSGTLYQAGDSGEPMLGAFCRIAGREDGMMMSSVDSQIMGANTGLTNPKGIALADDSGMIYVADFNAMRIAVFGSAAAGDVAPVAEIMLPAQPWDVAVDENADRMYVALTDGTIAVYDNVMGSDFAPSVMRIIVPSDASGTQISVNSHGIVYDADSDRLVVSDVGDASIADDGQIFVINNASTVDGAVEPARTIAGPSTMLGNPVDIILSGTTLRVAEKSNDAILVYTNIFSGDSGDIAPTLATSSVKPESLAELTDMPEMADFSDQALADVTIGGVSASSNPATAGDTTGIVVQFDASLGSQTAMFDTGMSIESVAYSVNGDGFVTYDDPETAMGGLLVVNRMASMRDDGMFSLSQDREIMGDMTGLVAPKGLDVNSEHALVFVADVNETSPAVRVFSGCAAGNVMPVMTLSASDGARPWDVDYDAETDRAFLALTNGTVAVFDEVTRKMMSGTSEITGEDRLLIPAMNGEAIAAPTNIHGIDYDAQSDALVISDVGSADSATDGKLYVIPDAGMADGLTDMTVNIAGPSSMLGNPVDIMLSNGNVYVAEKSNGMILRFDDIMNAASGDMAPDYSVSFTAPESVAVLPAYLW